MSATRKYLAPYTAMNAASIASTVSSSVVNISNLDQISIQITTTNTDVAGQWSVQGSLDYNPLNPNSATWTDMTFSPVIAATTAGVADQILLDLKLLAFPWIKVKFTRTAGTTGTGTVLISGKGN